MPRTWSGQLDPEAPSPIGQELRQTDDEHRLNLPVRFLENFTGVSRRGSGDCLVHLPEPGRLRLLPWETADKVLKLCRALRRRSDPTAERELRLLEDIYRRLHIEPPGRIQLPHLLLVHLSGSIAENQFFYVVRYESSIEIWSMEHRNAALKQRPDSFEDLP
jgi:hypothetical protein